MNESNSREIDLYNAALALPAGERAEYLRQACPDEALRVRVEELLRVQARADAYFDKLPMTAADRTVVSATTPKPITQHIRYFGDYELLEEVARGGMGVVWKARQNSLNRIVALKMILAGQLASEADVKRFRTEAEAAANLQHPNIVAIHEVGEHLGQQYFSMDYVDGTTLAEVVRQGALPAGKAATYVQAVAEAVQYAHQRGILHRDLKPSNVLVDSQDRVRITDFGLAKVMTNESDLTKSGDVMGTPAYMAPEQAQAKSKLVGPPSDVYSLGAILYHLLTGKQPFQGETVLQTLQMVLNEEPVPPTKLNTKIPADLETICLKCLQKNPAQRYSTARELAEELGRFLNYEPILAKPAGKMRYAWNWSQKNPWVFAGAFASLVVFLGCVAYGFFERTRYLDWGKANGAYLKPAPDNSPAYLLFVLVPLLGLLVQTSRKSFLQAYQNLGNRGIPQSARPLFVHAGLGLLGVMAGMGLILVQVKAWAWNAAPPSMLLLEVPGVLCAGVLNWLGFFAMWEATGMHESSRYREAVNRTLETDLEMDSRRETTHWSMWKNLGFGFFAVLCTCLGNSIFYDWLLLLDSKQLVFGGLSSLLFGGFLIKVWFAIRCRQRPLFHLFIPLIMLSVAMIVIASFIKPRCDWPYLLLLVKTLSLMTAFTIILLWFFKSNPLRNTTRSRAPRNPWLEAIGGLAIVIGLIALVQNVENWRGRRAWAQLKAELEAKGESLDYASFLQPPVPESDNVMAHPYMKKHFIRHSKDPTQKQTDLPISAPPRFYSDERVFSLDYLSKMSWVTTVPSIANLVTNRASLPILPLLTFSNQPLAVVVFDLAAKAGVAVQADTNQAPFTFTNSITKNALRISKSMTNLTAVQALDLIAKENFLIPSPEAWCKKNILLLSFGDSRPLRDILTWYGQYEAEFAQLEEALQRPHSRLSVNRTNELWTSEELNFYSIRVAAQTYANLCKVHLLMGDSKTALEKLKALRRLVDVAHSHEPGAIFETSAGTAVAGLFVTTLEETLRAGVWPANQLEKVQSLCVNADLLGHFSRSWRGGERAAMIQEVLYRKQLFNTDPRSAMDFLITNQEKEKNKSWANRIQSCFLWVYLYKGVFDHNLVKYVGLMQLVVDGWETNGQTLDTRKVAKGYGQRIKHEIDNSFHLYSRLAEFGIPSFIKVLYTPAMIQTRLDQTYLACALERYRAIHGVYPETLNSLVPAFAQKIPHDIFDGQPLRYRRTDDGKYLLYSIGWNSTDDGGVMAKDKDGKPEWSNTTGDWVWQGVPGK